ncbi:MAG TPA: radical SAM protein [Clostridiales bacterium]|nr:radical SAM protein [Clostridiales bacterium]
MMYTNPLYRPPSEARSLIIQLTEGCSYNKCTFCGMYKDKPFRLRGPEEIKSHIDYLKKYDPRPDKIFIADGNFLCLSTDKILTHLEMIQKNFVTAKRISCYAGPLDLIRKSSEDLTAIRNGGLDMLYMGVESGNDEVLKRINKGVTSKEMIEAGKKAVKHGFTFSCMIISGLGGEELSQAHALDSARVISEIDPHYFALLTLNLEPNTPLYQQVDRGEFKLMSPDDIMLETYRMIDAMSLTYCVFRSNHVSNYVNLSGILDRDKASILKKIEIAMSSRDYTPEYFRRL